MRYRKPPRVGYVVDPGDAGDQADDLYLIHLPDGAPQMVRGTAALIWLLAAEGNERIADHLAALIDDVPHDLAAVTAGYLDHLVSEGLLEPWTQEGSDHPATGSVPLDGEPS